ncbi:amidohydrolase [Rhodohalobacter sp. SW132]|uniref:amidohydrolase family protein n=1 Tax=Rhodohalobacter sp. SW132 TaxID=2293433 RepID=UPI000E22ABAF|nr:amidohydrolase family protein [Rhodohalobacter sp. SW132]REL38446.1 amidohydrolase [Rhodohalobacter sp. SW132]
MRYISTFTVLLAMLVTATAAIAQEQPKAFQGAEIITVAGDPIPNGTLIIQDGEITSVGPSASITIPSGAEIIDVTGRVIMPGLVDSHSHIGEGDGGDRSAALHPDVRIMDTINPTSDSFKRALSGGVTTANIMPGSGHLMSGQTVYVKLKEANKIEDMLVYSDEENGIYGGLKMANGTNSIRTSGPFPGTRARSSAMVRNLYIQAQEYRDKVEAANGDPDALPPRNLQMETLIEVLEGKRIVHNHTHRHDDILTAIRLADEFGYRMVLHHVSEGGQVAEEIAASGYPASIIVLDSPGGKHEAINLDYEIGPKLEAAGADVAYHTDDPITDSRLFLRSGAFGMRAGMSREKALEALTIANARMMDLDHRIGSLEEGKDADFIILNGDPFSVYTQVQQTWIDGKLEWDRENPDDRKFGTGGDGVFSGSSGHHHSHEGGK